MSSLRKTRRGTVTPIRPITPLQRGRSALLRGNWTDARRCFKAALAETDAPEAYEGLGLAAWWLDQADLVFESRQHAYRLYRQRQDRVAAARIAVWIAWDYAAFRGEMAVANGWLQRARTLLEGQPDCAERAWLAVRDGNMALLEDHDPERALELANDAIRSGSAVGAIDFEMIGAALRGFALVTTGQVAKGMRQLDEVSAAVLAGELTDPIAIGLSSCYLVAACERARDSDRAVQWCRRLKRFCTTWGLRPLLAVCRTQYASMCVWNGEWAEAEKELLTATAELSVSRPGMTGEGHARLGELRRRQGRLDEAARLFEDAGDHPLALTGRVALHLDRRETRKAIDLADRYLRHLPGDDRAERVVGLELLARACAAGGLVDRAVRASADLDRLSRHMPAPHVRASASAARGHAAAARNDDDDARRHFEDAVDLFERSGAPFESATARLDLARALVRLGQRSVAQDEVHRAMRTFDRIDAAFELQEAQALEKHLQALAASSAPTGAGGKAGALTARERDIVRLIAAGLSNDRIGRRLFISSHTVHRHVANVFAKLNVRTRSAVVARAAALGVLA